MSAQKYEIGRDKLSVTTLSLQKDINKNEPIHFKEDEGLLFTFFNILIKYGYGIMGLSFTLGKTRSGDGKTKYFINKSKLKVYAAAYAFICFYWLIQIMGEKFSVTNFRIINWIKRGTHIVLMFQLVITKYDWEKADSHNNLLAMLREADNLQAKFASCKIFFPKKEQVRKLAYVIMGLTGIWTIAQLVLFVTPPGGGGIKKFATFAFRFCTLNLVDVNEYLTPPMLNYFCALGLILDALPWAIFHFAGAIRIISVLPVWIIFHRLTRALEPGGVLEHKSLAEVMDLHMSATRIQHLMNEIFSSLTFFSTLYTILYACFWANSIIKAEEFSRIYIVTIFFVLKSGFILLMAADVNSKAHKITFWLEKFAGANPPTISASGVDTKAMSIWTCQLYNKEAIGFKGLNYFTITSSFISATVGLIITYTAVVVQFLEMEPHQTPTVSATDCPQVLGTN